MGTKNSHYKCPYENIQCTEINTSGLTQLKPCKECEHYGDGIRPSRGVYGFSWIFRLMNIKKKK